MANASIINNVRLIKDSDWKTWFAKVCTGASALQIWDIINPDYKLYTHQIRIPRTYTDVIRSPQTYAWKQAMDDQPRKTSMGLIERPTNNDINILTGKSVFDVKTDHGNIITKYRARWVICGNRKSRVLTMSIPTLQWLPIRQSSCIKHYCHEEAILRAN